MDYLTFFIETIMEDFMEHLKCYKAAHSKVYSSEGEGQGQEKLITRAKATLIEEAYFDEEDSNGPWRAVCCSQQSKQGQFVIL